MSTLIEFLMTEGGTISDITTSIIEAADFYESGHAIVESADSVLGQLSAKLKANAPLQADELEQYATLYTSLSMLADKDVRAAFNIDLTDPHGQAKFSTILNDTGTNPAVTREVAKVASETGRGKLEKMKNDLRNYPAMKPMDQQLFVNRINKLRIAFERAKQQLAQRDLPHTDRAQVLAA